MTDRIRHTLPTIAGAAGPPPLSPHPVDVLIRESIDTGRRVQPDEVDQIVERVATAPFDSRVIPVPTKYRGLSYQGRVLGARETALWYHLFIRIVANEQWAHGVTAVDYVADLRQVVRLPDSRIVVYTRRGGNIVGIIGSSDRGILKAHRGANNKSECYVVYSADRGIIISGYQFEDFGEIALSGNERWIR